MKIMSLEEALSHRKMIKKGDAKNIKDIAEKVNASAVYVENYGMVAFKTNVQCYSVDGIFVDNSKMIWFATWKYADMEQMFITDVFPEFFQKLKDEIFTWGEYYAWAKLYEKEEEE